MCFSPASLMNDTYYLENPREDGTGLAVKSLCSFMHESLWNVLTSTAIKKGADYIPGRALCMSH